MRVLVNSAENGIMQARQPVFFSRKPAIWGIEEMQSKARKLVSQKEKGTMREDTSPEGVDGNTF